MHNLLTLQGEQKAGIQEVSVGAVNGFLYLVKLWVLYIVNDTNTIFYSNEKIVSKLRSYGFSQCNIRILKMLLQGRVTIFWAHIFGGAGFLTVNLRRAKILEPLLYR